MSFVLLAPSNVVGSRWKSSYSIWIWWRKKEEAKMLLYVISISCLLFFFNFLPVANTFKLFHSAGQSANLTLNNPDTTSPQQDQHNDNAFLLSTPSQSVAFQQPISEAQELYCNHCLASCKANKNFNHQQRRQRAKAPTEGFMGELSGPEVLQHTKKEGEPELEAKRESETRIKLQCKCETVFDFKSRSFTCKNMSFAGGKIRGNGNGNRDKAWLEAQARAKAGFIKP